MTVRDEAGTRPPHKKPKKETAVEDKGLERLSTEAFLLALEMSDAWEFYRPHGVGEPILRVQIDGHWEEYSGPDPVAIGRDLYADFLIETAKAMFLPDNAKKRMP